MFVNYVPTTSLRAVQDASSKAHQAIGYGEVWVEVQCSSGETKILRIERVLHIPTFAVNILSETWVRSAGFGYWAPPWRLGKARIQAYGRDGKINDTIKLQPKGGLGFVYGRVTHQLTAAVLNRAESTAATINRQEHRKQYCSVANAKTPSEFKKQVENTTDATVLTDMLDGVDDEGFYEDAPRLDPIRKMQVRLRLADLQVLTTDNIAHSPFFLLHHKLGHAGMLETAKAAKESGIKLPPVEDRWCEACIRASLTKRSRSKYVVDREHLKPYQKVFTDIEGPFPVKSAYNGYRYLIGFICAKTHEGRVYGMHTLGEVATMTVEYLTWVRNQRESGEIEIETVREGTFDPVGYTTLQADSHSVYRSAKFRDSMQRDFGTKLQFSPPYDQSRNGMIERFWRTIGCRARALMFAQELTAEYWYWAYQHAVRCHEIVGTSANAGGVSPYEAKTGEKPTALIKNLRGFGCDCYVWVPNPGKLGEHGRKGKLVGWDAKNVSHIIFFPATRNSPLSIRTSQHIAIKDKRLPDAVLKGDVGMVFPEYKPFSEDDDVEVEIINDDTNRTTKNSPKRTDNVLINTKRTETGDACKRTRIEDSEVSVSSEVLVNGGASAPYPNVGQNGGVSTPKAIIPDHARVEEEEYSDEMQLTEGESDGDTTALQDELARKAEESAKREAALAAARNRKKPSTRKKSKRKRTFDPNSAVVDEEVLFISAASSERLLDLANFVGNVVDVKDNFAIGQIQFDVRKAFDSKYSAGFHTSVKTELQAIDKFDVMKDVLVTDIPADTTIFRSYMLCHRKSLGAGEWKCKSRLVVDGSMCITGLHTAEVDISTSLPGWNAMRVLCSVAKGNGWMIYAGDVRTAFLKADGSGIVVFMHMPVGLRKYKKTANGMVEICKAIHGNLYGKAVSANACVHIIVRGCNIYNMNTVVRIYAHVTCVHYHANAYVPETRR
jgi:hypothetical protein